MHRRVEAMPDDANQKSTQPPRRSTEYGGVGQSGYTAGRYEHDPSLEAQIEVDNPRPPKGSDEESEELGLDDRFTGRRSAPLRQKHG
jgi:hypothetical protein